MPANQLNSSIVTEEVVPAESGYGPLVYTNCTVLQAIAFSYARICTCQQAHIRLPVCLPTILIVIGIGKVRM